MIDRRMQQAAADARRQADRQRFHAQYPGYYHACAACGRLYLTRAGLRTHRHRQHGGAV
jgi:hypothetical protein